MKRSLTGTRIRQLRRAAGMRQAALADAAEISPSYLNLIEHNRRSPGTRILEALARAMDIPPASLLEDSESALMAELRDAAGLVAATGLDLDTSEELIARFPEWAELIASQLRTQREQAAAIATLTDRLNFDPHLQDTLYEMLTRIAAIRSSSSILVSSPDMSTDDTEQFQTAIASEAGLLSEAAQELVTYFDRGQEASATPATPEEAFEMFLESHDHVFPKLEQTSNPEEAVEALIDDAPLLMEPDAKSRARTRLLEYANDAAALPLEPFWDVARSTAFSPIALSQHFDQPVFAVLRRLATLRRNGLEAPEFGLVIVNAAGNPLFRRTLRTFSVPRFVTICALWPVFQALTAPGQPLQDILVMPDGGEFFARAFASPLSRVDFGARPVMASAMLVTPLNQAFAFGMYTREANVARVEVGTSCRLCVRANCNVRAAPPIVGRPDQI